MSQAQRKTQQEKSKERRGEREQEEGSSMKKWVSDQGKESKRVRERERALWIVSGLRHSVNRRCFCMHCQCTALLQGIARSFASHIYRPCLPTSTSLQQPLPARWENTRRAREWTKNCEPQGMRAASLIGMSHWDDKEYCYTRKQWTGFTSLNPSLFFFLASVTESMITRLNGFKPYKSVIASRDGW